MTPGPIPYSAIREFAEKDQGSSQKTFIRIIRQMDKEFLTCKSGDSKPFSRDMMKR